MTGKKPSVGVIHDIQLGSAHLQAGRLSEAEAIFARLLASDPDNLSLLETLGRICHQAGKFEQAGALFERAVRTHPSDAAVRFNIGVALEERGRLEEALRRYRQALGLDPAMASAHLNLGVVLHKLDRLDEAAVCFRRTLALAPRDAHAYNNLGLTQRRLGRLEEALASHRRAVELAPENASAHNNLGTILQDLGQAGEAEACFRDAWRIKPDLYTAQWNLATLLLSRGAMQEGFTLYERRFHGGDEASFGRARRRLLELATTPRWMGEHLRGRRLLIWAEQGLGDAIMMLRYLPLLKPKGAGAVILSCWASLVKLSAVQAVATRVIEEGTPLAPGDFDCHCPIMSLPFLFATRLETIPNAVPYLSVPAALSERWRRRLAALPGLKVGLAWAGSRALRDDRLRSIAFPLLAPLLGIPGVQMVSLQKDGGKAHPALQDWIGECDDLLDTAALIQQLDLIISVDTAVAHLAGALGRPVWLLNRRDGDWRWMLDREDSPWYPTMRIFRQPRRGDWDSVISRVADALGELVKAALTLAMEEGKRHYAAGRWTEAEAAFRRTLAINAQFADSYNALGNTHLAQGRYIEAEASYRRALECDRASAKLHANLGIALQRRGDLEAALSCQRRALALDPDSADICNNLGSLYQELGRLTEAEAWFRGALQRRPAFPLTQCNLAVTRLLQADFAEGLALYEQRFLTGEGELSVFSRETLATLSSTPRWRGEDLHNKTVFLWREQGFGDAIMMARYLPRLKARGAAAVLVSAHPALTRLLQTLPAVDSILEDGMVPECDYHCPLMSLPYAFGTRLESIPADVPYLGVPEAMGVPWRQRVAALGGLKVGLAWAGSRSQRKDALRSIAFERLTPLLAVPGVSFVSLQKEGSVAHPALRDWMSVCGDFLDTAALIQQLDLVISVDTAAAHLAGALAKPVWLLNRYESEWRWLLEREDSPWYPTMRIFRQPRRLDWDSVIAAVAEKLRSPR